MTEETEVTESTEIQLAVYEKEIPMLVGESFEDTTVYVVCNVETKKIISGKYFLSRADAELNMTTLADYAEGSAYATSMFPGITGAALKTKANAVAMYLKWNKDGRKVTELKPVAAPVEPAAADAPVTSTDEELEEEFMLEDED